VLVSGFWLPLKKERYSLLKPFIHLRIIKAAQLSYPASKV